MHAHVHGLGLETCKHRLLLILPSCCFGLDLSKRPYKNAARAPRLAVHEDTRPEAGGPSRDTLKALHGACVGAESTRWFITWPLGGGRRPQLEKTAYSGPPTLPYSTPPPGC